MDLEYDILPELHQVRVRARGEFELKAVAESIIDVSNNPAVDPHFSVLVDLRGIGESLPGLEELEAIASVLELRKGAYQGPMAVVSRRGDLYNLVQLTCARAAQGGLRVRAFDTLAEAERWIEASDPPPDVP